MQAEKIQLQHPAGKKAFRIDRKKYEVMRKAILRCLKKGPLTHSQMLEAILSDFRKRKPAFEGSVEWYMEGVKLDLEAIKIIERLLEKPAPKWRLSGPGN